MEVSLLYDQDAADGTVGEGDEVDSGGWHLEDNVRPRDTSAVEQSAVKGVEAYLLIGECTLGDDGEVVGQDIDLLIH